METVVWSGRLITAAEQVLPRVRGAVEAADPRGAVRPRSAILCASLGVLATACYEGLGGRGRESDVLECAALLSLLTKVDDQVIDAAAFHGGRTADRGAAAAAVERHLAPTLRSIERASPTTDEGRCALAARLGERLRALSAGGDRLDDLLEVIRWGWAVQARAVAIYGAHPAEVTPEEVDAVSADISHAWLLMITLVGALPAEAAPLAPAERAAFAGWGRCMQRADALADLDKDVLEDGFASSAAGRLAWDRAGEAWLDAVDRGDTAELYRIVRAHDVDLDLLPPVSDLDALEARVPTGGVGSLLRWVHGLLAWRYTLHPSCRRDADHPRLAALASRWDVEGWRAFVAAATAAEGVACSAR